MKQNCLCVITFTALQRVSVSGYGVIYAVWLISLINYCCFLFWLFISLETSWSPHSTQGGYGLGIDDNNKTTVGKIVQMIINSCLVQSGEHCLQLALLVWSAVHVAGMHFGPIHQPRITPRIPMNSRGNMGLKFTEYTKVNKWLTEIHNFIG